MNLDFLAKIIQLVQKKGEKFIVVNPNNEAQAIIIMPFSEYEKISLTPLTTNLKTDKIKNESISPIPPSSQTQSEKKTQTSLREQSLNEDEWGGDELFGMNEEHYDERYYMEPLDITS
jgi:hypothetical protein